MDNTLVHVFITNSLVQLVQRLEIRSVLYHKTKNLFEANICMKISFQLL